MTPWANNSSSFRPTWAVKSVSAVAFNASQRPPSQLRGGEGSRPRECIVHHSLTSLPRLRVRVATTDAACPAIRSSQRKSWEERFVQHPATCSHSHALASPESVPLPQSQARFALCAIGVLVFSRSSLATSFAEVMLNLLTISRASISHF